MIYLTLTISMLWFPVNTINYCSVNYCKLSYISCGETITATLTAYNTVPQQTWGDPCLSASGVNICGMDNALACPRKYSFFSEFEIDGKIWICYDRLARKYDDRFDLSFDKDIQGARKYGKQVKEIIIK